MIAPAQRPRALGAARTAGFTLMEVIVAIMITALLMTAVTQMLTTTRITRDSIHNHQEKMLAGPAILDLIEADLRALTVYNRTPELTFRVRNRIMAGLDGDSMDFVSSRDSLVATESRNRWVNADTNEVGYRLRPNPEDNDFLELYRREDFGIDDEPFDGGTYTFLHDRIKTFDIQIFDEDGPDAEPLEDWNENGEATALPPRLEITLELEIAPRLVREQFRHLSKDKRRLAYKRILRLPQSLLLAQQRQPVPKIPDIEPPAPDDQVLGGEGLDGTGGDASGGTDILGGGGGGGGGLGGGGGTFPGGGGGR